MPPDYFVVLFFVAVIGIPWALAKRTPCPASEQGPPSTEPEA